ncbi:polysaccharide deacetylase family protein [Lewinella sp. LCG006]|uniref:polysaccharide deacetylase family protein n=1 Tax=Lewinella sp. LCG006 TaxID=3231911 RepID=UPI00345FB28F
MNLHILSKKASYYARCVATDLICQLGGRTALLREQEGACILLYHGIDFVNNTRLNARFLAQKKLHQQLSYCKEHFHILSLEDYFQGNFAPGRMNIAITFDDGYLNNLELALPVLEDLQVPATFFVTAIDSTPYPMLWTDYLDLVNFRYQHTVSIQGEVFEHRKREYFNTKNESLKAVCKRKDWTFKSSIYSTFPELVNDPVYEAYKMYWQVMNAAQIRQLAASPWASVGSHGYYHDDLGELPLEKAVELLQKGKNYLEEALDQSIHSLAYPNGSYTPTLVNAAKQLGFEQQLVVNFQQAADQDIPEIRSRLTINPFVSLDNQIRAILRGDY